MARKTRPATAKAKPAKAASASSGASKGPGKAKGKSSAPAAPLLATSPKKVSKTSAPKGVVPAAKPSPSADYQPKTAVPHADNAPVRARPASTIPAMDPFAFMRPWIHIGLQATAASLTMQARLVRAAMSLPPTTMAMRQSTKALDTWLDLTRPVRPARPKD